MKLQKGGLYKSSIGLSTRGVSVTPSVPAVWRRVLLAALADRLPMTQISSHHLILPHLAGARARVSSFHDESIPRIRDARRVAPPHGSNAYDPRVPEHHRGSSGPTIAACHFAKPHGVNTDNNGMLPCSAMLVFTSLLADACGPST